MSIINVSQLQVIPLFNCKVAANGPIAFPITLNFTTSQNLSIDISQLEKLGFLDHIQTLYIDTNGLSAPLTITFRGSNQNIIVNQNTEGYYAVLCPNPTAIDFSSAGNAVASVILFNNPVAPFSWLTA